MAGKPKLTCQWCNLPILPNQPHLRLGGENCVVFLVHRDCYDKLLINKPKLVSDESEELIPISKNNKINKKDNKEQLP